MRRGYKMKETKIHRQDFFKTMYEDPRIDIIEFSGLDIITASGDPHEGEWDPQENWLKNKGE